MLLHTVSSQAFANCSERDIMCYFKFLLVIIIHQLSIVDKEDKSIAAKRHPLQTAQRVQSRLRSSCRQWCLDQRCLDSAKSFRIKVLISNDTSAQQNIEGENTIH